MCAIIGSFSLEKLNELADLNAYRGSFSHSLMVIDRSNNIISIEKGFGVLDFSNYPQSKSCYYLAHIQAPTNGLVEDVNRIHPYRDHTGNLLYHNGIIKASFLAEFGFSGWDTQMLGDSIEFDYSALSDIDGSFSCVKVYPGKAIHLFRNSTSPLFIDNELNISSTKFDKSITTPYNKVLQMNLHNESLNGIEEFDNVNEPYYLG